MAYCESDDPTGPNIMMMYFGKDPADPHTTEACLEEVSKYAPHTEPVVIEKVIDAVVNVKKPFMETIRPTLIAALATAVPAATVARKAYNTYKKSGASVDKRSGKPIKQGGFNSFDADSSTPVTAEAKAAFEGFDDFDAAEVSDF
jgi:hypothetical protein